MRDFAASLVMLAWLLVGLGLLGCSRGPDDPEPGRTSLRKVATAYDVGVEMRRRPPRTVEELKTYLKDLHPNDDPDALLRSPRDGQPYVIIYGTPLDAYKRDTILAYERDGAEGQRYVLMLSRDIKVLTDEEFAAATFAQSHKPAGKN